MKNKVSFALILVLLVMTLLPSSVVFVVLGSLLSTQDKFYRNKEIQIILSDYEKSLKALSHFDKENEGEYREKFKKNQNQKLIYGDDDYFKEILQKTMMEYFSLVFGGAILMSLLIGFVMSLYIHKNYLNLFASLEKEKERTRYLTEISKWQEVARSLAHELRKTLQPIRFWLGSLNVILNKNSSLDQEKVKEVTAGINEEIMNIANLMDHFRQFSTLPEPVLMKVEINSFLENFLQQFSKEWENVNICTNLSSNTLFVSIDQKLFRNVFINIIDNASEANPGSLIKLLITTSRAENYVNIEFFNTGVSLDEKIREKIFDLHFSTKDTIQNSGLGLAIAKTTILQHQGEIYCVPEDQGVRFAIKLPVCREV